MHFITALFHNIFVSIRKYIHRIFRDINFLSGLIPALLDIKRTASRSSSNWSIASFWAETVKRHNNRPALVFVANNNSNNDQSFTFAEIDKWSNKCARTALSIGFIPGGDDTTVAILMENCPEYIFLLIGFAKLGITTSLLSTQIRGESLGHCIKACGANRVICSKDTFVLVEDLLLDDGFLEGVDFMVVGSKEEKKGVAPCTNGTSSSCIWFDFASETNGSCLSTKTRNGIMPSDTFLHLFTSGTTGMPKAAKVSHIRYYGSSQIFSKLCRFHGDDVIYCPLPFYHSSAIVLGLGLSWHNGIPLVFRTKFSASRFWNDCVTYNVTVVQYIGELCRYLTAVEDPHPNKGEKTKHSVRLALGNGLREDVWNTFQQRFNIPQIIEFYASTEGNVGLINTPGKIGAIGFLSPLIAKKHPGKILLYDYERNMPYRNKYGQCVECKVGEVGEFVGMIKKEDVTQRFQGYCDKRETDKKVLRDVLSEGDECFRSGDLMTKDEDGFVYFVDRIGDTFRWKGENVSTTEVENILIQNCKQILECTVFGVPVNGYDGKAGMAIIRVLDTTKYIPLSELSLVLQANLPPYAWPIFFRFTMTDMDTTGTFKYRKRDMMRDSFDPNNTRYGTDKLMILRKEKVVVVNDDDSKDLTKGVFVELTEKVHSDILFGRLQLT